METPRRQPNSRRAGHATAPITVLDADDDGRGGGLGVALGACRLDPLELLHAYEMSFFSLIGLSPILTGYLWLRQPQDRDSSASVETLIGKVAVVLAVGFLFWVLFALWADPF